MKREQIIEILTNHSDHYGVGFNVTGNKFATVADAILALLEQKESKGEKTAEEILAKNYISEKDLKGINTWDAIIRVMEEYRQQPQKVEQEGGYIDGNKIAAIFEKYNPSNVEQEEEKQNSHDAKL